MKHLSLQHYGAIQIQRIYIGYRGRETYRSFRAQYRVQRLSRQIDGLVQKFDLQDIIAKQAKAITRDERQELLTTIAWSTDFLIRSRAAIKVQSIVFGINARRRCIRMRRERLRKLKALRESSAAVIQDLVRSWLQRRTCRATTLRRVIKLKLRELTSAGDAYTRTRDLHDYVGQSLLTRYVSLLRAASRTPHLVSRADTDVLYAIAKEAHQLLLRDRCVLKLQCRFRIRSSSIATMLLRQARDRQLSLEKRSASLVQARFRANQARRAMQKMVIDAKRRGLKDTYISERRAQSAREVWVSGEKETRARDIAQRKLERVHRAQVLALEEAARIDEVRRRKAETDRICANAATAKRKFEAHLEFENAAKKAWRRYADEYGTVYYHNLVTEETVWEAPKDWEEDRRANPPVMVDMSTQMETVPPLCQACRNADACRLCNDGCGMNFCLPCWTREHSRPDLQHHSYTQLKFSEEKSVMCMRCESNDASYKLSGGDDDLAPTFFCAECFAYMYSYEAPPSYSQFSPGTPECIECKAEIAQRRCLGCHNDPLCISCFSKLHKGPVMSQHTFSKIDTGECDVLKAGEVFCTECERSLAVLVCHQCNDDFCADCFAITHRKGRRAEHTTSDWATARGNGWEEVPDDVNGTMIYFNHITKKRQNEKPPELMFGPERAEYELRQKEIKLRQSTEAELSSTTKKLEKAESDRKRLLEANKKLIDKARSQTFNRIKMVGNLIMPSIVTLDTEEYGHAKEKVEEELKDFDALQGELRERLQKKKEGAERARAFRHEKAERRFFERKLARKYATQEEENNAVFRKGEADELRQTRKKKLLLK